MRPPFDSEHLDALMEEGGIDLVVATSKHNVRYLLGTHSFFSEHFEAIGVDRFLPMVGYRRARSEEAFAIWSEMERWQHEVEPFWVHAPITRCQTSLEATAVLVDQVHELSLGSGTLAIEHSFLPASALAALQRSLPQATLVEAGPVLDELRAVKTAGELRLLRQASEAIVESLETVARAVGVGITTREIAELVRIEETVRGLNFEYLLAATGPSFNRVPSGARWEEGAILSLDSGGEKHGYIGDLCRMAVLGEPTSRMEDLLGQVRSIQAAARQPIRAGAIGVEIYESALAEVARCSDRELAGFVAHGMGLVSHEAPRLTDSGPIRYPATHRDRPLSAGMVISIETELRAPGVGLIKLEDTVVVTEDGHEAYGDAARDWICVPV
jgi:Xaa-Pro aminopeptidase